MATDLGLRQRKQSTGPEKSTNSTQTIIATCETAVQAMADRAPPAIKPYIIKAIPYVSVVVLKTEQTLPLIQKGYDKTMELWEKLRPYKPELLTPAVVGLILVFFGGSFLTLIAAVEAYRMCGYESTLQCLRDLYNDFNRCVEANRKDDQEDTDGNGVADVLETSKQQLLMRKTMLFLKTVDPNRITNAISGINAGFLAVAATLKLQFAKAITLGNAIGNMVEVPVMKYALPVCERTLPPDFRRWARPLIEYTVRSAAISLAWFIQRVLSAFHSALRGGLMFSRNILEYLSVMKIVEINHEETYLDEVVGYALAFVGLVFQLRWGFTLPFPLNVLLFPFSLMEWFLVWAIAK